MPPDRLGREQPRSLQPSLAEPRERGNAAPRSGAAAETVEGFWDSGSQWVKKTCWVIAYLFDDQFWIYVRTLSPLTGAIWNPLIDCSFASGRNHPFVVLELRNQRMKTEAKRIVPMSLIAYPETALWGPPDLSERRCIRNTQRSSAIPSKPRLDVWVLGYDRGTAYVRLGECR